MRTKKAVVPEFKTKRARELYESALQIEAEEQERYRKEFGDLLQRHFEAGFAECTIEKLKAECEAIAAQIENPSTGEKASKTRKTKAPKPEDVAVSAGKGKGNKDDAASTGGEQ